MAKNKSKAASSEVDRAELNREAWRKKKWTKAELDDSALLCSLPFIRDTRGEVYHDDPGLYWWRVDNPDYWHQGIVVGESFCDKVADVLPQNPKRIEQALCHSLEAMLHKGGSNGVEIGFLRRMAHYAVKGMQTS